MNLFTLRQVAEELFEEIFAMGDHLIVTVLSDYMGSESYDIRDGNVGHHPMHKDLFIEHLEEALTNHGAVMVRKFLPETIMADMPKGRMEIPIKELYGAFCSQGVVHRLDMDDVRMAQETDAQTGEALTPEEGVVYCSWPEPNGLAED